MVASVNTNFIVQNGLTVGPTTIFAGNGDVITAGNISTTSTTPASFVNLTVSGNLTVQGTTTSVQNETATGNITPAANVTYNIGSTTAWWNNFYGTAVHALYADLAENYQADKFYNPGTVLMFGGDQEVTLASADTTAVAGIVSTNPAHLMNGALTGQYVVPLALIGRVPCQVIGPVAKGDLLVSAGFGYAKTNNTPAVGTVLGKALEDFGVSAKGVIEVVVGRV